MNIEDVAGTYLFLDADIEKTIEYIKECAGKARKSLLAATKIRKYVAGAIDRFQPDDAGTQHLHRATFLRSEMHVVCLTATNGSEGLSPCAGQKLTGKLEISVTAVPRFRNVRIRKFNSNKQLRNAILASACIVPPPIKLGVHGFAMDGAFSDFQILKVLLSMLSATASNYLFATDVFAATSSGSHYIPLSMCHTEL